MNINATLRASAECGFPLENIIFEITEVDGVERVDEYTCLLLMGVNYFQGYYFAFPAFEELPEVSKGLFNF